jgi:hypothetical protein
MSKASLRVRHVLSRQSQSRKVFCVQHLLYSNFGSHRMLKVESGNFCNDDVKICSTISL